MPNPDEYEPVAFPQGDFIMSQTNNVNRRQFIKHTARLGTAALAFPYVVPDSALGKDAKTAPCNRVNLGCIGVGVQGTGDMKAFLQMNDVRVAAVCDVYKSQRQKAKRIVDHHYGNNDCMTYNDFRDVCARPDIDAILMAACDHWHVLIGLEAVRNGKDIYFEKAMGLSLEEDKTLRYDVLRRNAVFQFGTQQRSSQNFRFACELVRNKKIGDLHTILVGSPASIPFPVQKPGPVPDGFDYKMWLGPAPDAPYSYQRCRPHNNREGYSNWYHISDYCQGFIAGWGIHHLDIAQWGNGTEYTGPIWAKGTGKFPKGGMTDCATSWEVELMFPDEVKMIYVDNETSKKRARVFPPHGRGVLFLGTDGWVFVCRGHIDAHPKSLLTATIGANEIHLPVSYEHHRNFIDAVKAKSRPISPVESALRSDTLCHIANIAIKLRRKLYWDDRAEKFSNDDEANKMLTRSMSSPWHL